MNSVDWSKVVRGVRRSISNNEARTITQGSLAVDLGYGKSSVSKWECGSREPDMALKVLLTLLTEDPSFMVVIRRIVKDIESKQE